MEEGATPGPESRGGGPSEPCSVEQCQRGTLEDATTTKRYRRQRQHRTRQNDCWYPQGAYLVPLAGPPSSRRHASYSSTSRPNYEESLGSDLHHAFHLEGHMDQLFYNGHAGHAFAVGSGCVDQSGCWYPAYAVPIMMVPVDFSQHYHHGWQQHSRASGWVHSGHADPSYECPELHQWDEESDASSCCSSVSPEVGSSEPTPNYIIDPNQEADSWANMNMSIMQNIMSKISEGDAKSVRLVCRHWRAVLDHNLEQLTPNALMSKLIVLRFPNLRALQLTNCTYVRNRDLMTIAASGMKLHTLTLGDDSAKAWVTNQGIACISNITSLTSLVLQDCNNVTNNGLLALNKLTSLEALSLKGCKKLTNSGLEALQRNTALTSLNLFGCKHIADKGLLSLTNLNLITLTLGCTRVRDEGLAHLAKMTSLRELHFEKEAMTDVGIKTLSSLTNLHSLALRDCGDVSGDSLAHLVPQLPNLQSLDLYKNFSIDDSQLSKCLDFLSSVTFLDLRGTFVTEGGLQELTRLSSLQKLCLAPTQESSEVWGEYMCVISNLTQLTSLTINNCQMLSFPLAKSLRLLKQLRELDLSDVEKLEVTTKPPVNHAAVDVMATITSLTSIDLSRRPVHEGHLNVLAERLPKLHMLIIIGCPVLTTEVQALQRRFPELTIHRKPLPDVSCSSSDHGSSTG